MKTAKNHLKVFISFKFFSHCDIRMEQVRCQNAEKININRFLWTVNALSKLEKRKREDNIIEHIKNLFRLRKEIDNSITKDIRNLFRLKKENETISDKIIRDI